MTITTMIAMMATPAMVRSSLGLSKERIIQINPSVA